MGWEMLISGKGHVFKMGETFSFAIPNNQEM